MDVGHDIVSQLPQPVRVVGDPLGQSHTPAARPPTIEHDGECPRISREQLAAPNFFELYSGDLVEEDGTLIAAQLGGGGRSGFADAEQTISDARQQRVGTQGAALSGPMIFVRAASEKRCSAEPEQQQQQRASKRGHQTRCGFAWRGRHDLR